MKLRLKQSQTAADLLNDFSVHGSEAQLPDLLNDFSVHGSEAQLPRNPFRPKYNLGRRGFSQKIDGSQ